MTPPEVSVLLPFRDPGPEMEEALESLRIQSLEEFQVVLVNDNSHGQSVACAERWCGTDPRFTLVDSQGQGLVDALNTGLGQCTGEWVARMDADDICAPDRLEKQLLMAGECSRKTVISCLVRSFPDDLVSEGYRVYEEWLNGLVEHDQISSSIFVESPVPHPTAFFHRDSVLDAGGYAERELPEDYELWLRLWSRGFRFRKVPEVLLHWRESEVRFSRTDPAYSLTSFYKLKARYLASLPRLSGKQVVFAGSGQTARRLGRWIQAEGIRIMAFIDPDPERQGSRLRGAPVVSPEEALQNLSGVPILVAVRLPGVREEIVRHFQKQGLHPWSDFIICS